MGTNLPTLLCVLLLFYILPAGGTSVSDTLVLGLFEVPVENISESHFKSYHNGDIRIFSLKKDHSNIGHTIWLNRKSGKVKAKYFAHKDLHTSKSVYQKYSGWKGAKEILLVCSGAFTTKDYSTPLGLTVDNGKIVNRNINKDMDGLVIVYATGGIVVSDIDEGNLYLGSLNKRIDPRNFMDKQTLISWAEKEEATIFQTQLLAYKNNLRIPSHAPKEEAERRLLVLAINPENEVEHIIFNIRREFYLYNISELVFNYLKAKNMNIVAMLNLDTGMYNILEVYDDDGDRENNVKGKENVSKATNLLTYYYEN